MNAPFPLVVCLGGVFCLAPLAIYLLWLAQINRRNRPTVVSGPWDFAALVAGLSGFVIFGGGIVLTLLQSNFRHFMRGNLEAFRAAWGTDKYTWMIISAVYLLLVVGWVVVTLASRRLSLVVYNVEATEFETTATELLEHLGQPVQRKGKVWFSKDGPLFALDRFDEGHTVTLRWVSQDHALFEEFERLLRESIAGIAPHENPAARWLLATAGGTGFWAACSFGLLLVYVYHSR